MGKRRKDSDAASEADGVTEFAEPRGHCGTMSPEDKKAYDADLLARVNQPGDADVVYHMTSVTPKGRDADADLSMYDDGDDSDVPVAARVGNRTVEHPRSRIARAMHESFGGAQASGLTHDDLAGSADAFGLHVDGTGSNGAVLKSDLVRAFDDLAREYPAPASP